VPKAEQKLLPQPLSTTTIISCCLAGMLIKAVHSKQSSTKELTDLMDASQRDGHRRRRKKMYFTDYYKR